MGQILHIGSLRSFEAGDLCLEEVVADSLFGVLRFEPIDFARLGPNPGLEHLPVPLAGSCSVLQLSLACFQLGLEVSAQRVGSRRLGGTVVSPASTVPEPVGAAR